MENECACVCVEGVGVVTVKVSGVGVSQASQLWPGAQEPSLSHLCLAAAHCWPCRTAAHKHSPVALSTHMHKHTGTIHTVTSGYMRALRITH